MSTRKNAEKLPENHEETSKKRRKSVIQRRAKSFAENNASRISILFRNLERPFTP